MSHSCQQARPSASVPVSMRAYRPAVFQSPAVTSRTSGPLMAFAQGFDIPCCNVLDYLLYPPFSLPVHVSDCNPRPHRFTHWDPVSVISSSLSSMTDLLELVIPPTSGPAVQRLARPSGIRETRGSIPGLALSFLLPQLGPIVQHYIMGIGASCISGT